MALAKSKGRRQNSTEKIRSYAVRLRSHLLLTLFSRLHSKTAGIASTKAPAVKMTEAVKEAAMRELEGHTGDTESETEE